jgi:glycosyltransferase involved in cell wall biosynthesis
VIVCHFTHDLGSLRWALRGRDDIRLIVIKHVSPGPPKTDWLHRWMYKRVDRLLGVSEFVAQKCRSSYPIDPARVGVWYPGVDVDRFAFSEGARQQIRARYKTDDAHIVIGYVGRVTPNKGLEDLLAAFHALYQDHTNARLWIVGGPSADEQDYDAGLRGWVESHGLAQGVMFCGYQEDVPAYMSALDIFVTPSREESFGLTTVEAMAAARPVVGFDVAGTGEIVRHDESGGLASPAGDTAHNLTTALRGILSNPECLPVLGEGGLSRSRNLFSHSAMRERLESAF